MDAEKLQKLLNIGMQMSEKREVNPLLCDAMRLALDFVGAEYGHLVLLQPDGSLEFRVGQDNQGNPLDEPQEQISHTILNQVITSGRATVTADALSNYGTDSVLELKIRSVICAPLIARGRILGAIYAENRSGVALFDEEDLELLEYFAAQAAISIENAILNDQLESLVRMRTAELEEANQKLQELAIRDALTGTFNRRHFLHLAETEFNRSQRYEHPLSVMMVDLDHFKKVNDQYGHMVGDRVLQAVASHLQGSIRDVDILGRYGGEEFCILLPNTDAASALQIGERLCQTTRNQSIEVNGNAFQITASIGISTLETSHAPNIERFLDCADQALYKAKNSGRDRVMAWQEQPERAERSSARAD